MPNRQGDGHPQNNSQRRKHTVHLPGRKPEHRHGGEQETPRIEHDIPDIARHRLLHIEMPGARRRRSGRTRCPPWLESGGNTRETPQTIPTDDHGRTHPRQQGNAHQRRHHSRSGRPCARVLPLGGAAQSRKTFQLNNNRHVQENRPQPGKPTNDPAHHRMAAVHRSRLPSVSHGRMPDIPRNRLAGIRHHLGSHTSGRTSGHKHIAPQTHTHGKTRRLPAHGLRLDSAVAVRTAPLHAVLPTHRNIRRILRSRIRIHHHRRIHPSQRRRNGPWNPPVESLDAVDRRHGNHPVHTRGCAPAEPLGRHADVQRRSHRHNTR